MRCSRVPHIGLPDQCRKTTVSFRYYRVGENSTQSDGTAWTASPRRAAATAGCAVSPRNFGQAEPKRVDHMDGHQSCSKWGQKWCVSAAAIVSSFSPSICKLLCCSLCMTSRAPCYACRSCYPPWIIYAHDGASAARVLSISLPL